MSTDSLPGGGWSASQYYAAHTCKTCADAPNPTPLEYAQQLLNVYNYQMQPLLTTYGDEFSNGWLMGVEGRSEYRPVPIGETYDNRPTQAFLMGLIAGRFASVNNWSSPVCRDGDPTVNGHVWIEPVISPIDGAQL